MENSLDIVNRDLDFITSTLSQEFRQLSGKKILITGGAGFLGYYLVKSLLYYNSKIAEDQQVSVTVYDNFIRGVPAWLTDLSKQNGRFKLVQHDITKPLPHDIEHYEFIIHAASIASPTYYRMHPIETMDANVNGLRILLDQCLKQQKEGGRLEGFLYFSSSEIYGDATPENIPTPENYFGNVSCTGPRACYDESKRYAETLCVNFFRQYGLPIRIARPFNNYGPGLRITDRRVIPDLAKDILNGRDIVLYSDGAATRTFCYITDAITGYYKVLINGGGGEAYNIGTDQPEISISKLAQKAIDLSKSLFNYKGKIIYKISPDKEYLTDNPNRRCPQISKARMELDYNPTISLDEGLRRSFIWYQDHYREES